MTDQEPVTEHGAMGPPETPRALTGRNLVVLSGPSGAGKTTVCHAVAERLGVPISTSATTRPQRPGEVDGRDYHFISIAEFVADIADNAWAEWAKVHGNYYGTRAADLNQALDSGCDVLLDIDVQGARQLEVRFPASVTIFIMPPSLEVLESRLRQRGTDPDPVIARRLANAREEMAQRSRYRHVVVNDDLQQAAEALTRLVQAYRNGRAPHPCNV